MGGDARALTDDLLRTAVTQLVRDAMAQVSERSRCLHRVHRAMRALGFEAPA